MSEAPPRVRVAVLEPDPGQPGAGSTVVEALLRLGPEAQIERFHDPAAARAARGVVDLVVADQAIGGRALLDWITGTRGPEAAPVLVVVRETDESFALDAFRHGAADCVLAGAGLEDVLPTAALELLRRRRDEAASARAEHLGRQVDALERRTRGIIENMNSALLVVDPAARISYANPTAERLLDAEPGSLAGSPVDRFFPGELRPELSLHRTLSRGERFRGHETLLTRADGQVLPVGLSSAPLENEAGEREGAVVIFQDLTGIKQLQQQVLQTEKMASIGQLAAGVAHEINNPMGFIHANLCQLAEYLDDLEKVWERVGALRKGLEREAGTAEVADAARELEAIVTEVDADFLISDFGKAIRESLEGSERIRNIVQDLRAFSHQDTAERVLADVNRALDSTANIVWTMMKHSVVLTKHYDELPPVPCYPMQLQQVFMNLLVNAYQAIEERAAREDLRGEITLRTELAEQGVRITVSDNGSGIAPEALPRIFDPFFTTKQVGVGTGLGLATSYQLVERHGGRMRVESEPGAGASFEVWLPLLADEPGHPW